MALFFKSKMPAEYDNIADQYKKAAIEKRIHRQYVLIPTFLHFLKDVKNKTVLDLACGEGFWTRIIQEKGAAKVVGIDLSKKMIDLAKKDEKTNPRIEYFVYNVAKLPKIGEFDLITAMFLLHFSKTKKELFSMCENIHKNLKTGGRFFAMNSSPTHPFQNNKKYDFTMKAKKPLKEGDIIVTTIFKEGVKLCSFKAYFWKKETYETALKEAGFKTIKWHNPIISQEGIEMFGCKFWKEYLETPANIVIGCEK